MIFHTQCVERSINLQTNYQSIGINILISKYHNLFFLKRDNVQINNLTSIVWKESCHSASVMCNTEPSLDAKYYLSTEHSSLTTCFLINRNARKKSIL